MTMQTAAENPVLLAIIQKQLDHITLQMGRVMTRTARSPIFSQSHDFSCFLGSASGLVVAQADGLPIHSGAGGFALQAVLRDYADDMAGGDVFLLSDPYAAGGNHLPDWTLIRPVFTGGIMAGFAANRAHQSDIGGGAAGTYNPEATEIFHEGLRLPVMRLVERGRLRRDVFRLLLLNSRYPDLMEGDLGAMLGSVQIGAERLGALIAELGREVGAAYLEAVLGVSNHAGVQSGITTILRSPFYRGMECRPRCYVENAVPPQPVSGLTRRRQAVPFGNRGVAQF
jgi:N-methylhydantoinase B